jgi:hypothetical protein
MPVGSGTSSKGHCGIFSRLSALPDQQPSALPFIEVEYHGREILGGGFIGRAYEP